MSRSTISLHTVSIRPKERKPYVPVISNEFSRSVIAMIGDDPLHEFPGEVRDVVRACLSLMAAREEDRRYEDAHPVPLAALK